MSFVPYQTDLNALPLGLPPPAWSSDLDGNSPPKQKERKTSAVPVESNRTPGKHSRIYSQGKECQPKTFSKIGNSQVRLHSTISLAVFVWGCCRGNSDFKMRTRNYSQTVQARVQNTW